MTYLYHRVPPDMIGTTLYPLNQMKDMPEFSQAYESHKSKYDSNPRGSSRIWLMDQKIHPLKCLWNDVLFFSPVHPEDIAHAIKESGCNHHESEWFVIHPYDLPREQTTMAFFAFGQSVRMKENYLPFNPLLLPAHSTIPDETISYYQDISKNPDPSKRNPLYFVGITHILYKGTLETEGLERIVA